MQLTKAPLRLPSPLRLRIGGAACTWARGAACNEQGLLWILGHQTLAASGARPSLASEGRSAKEPGITLQAMIAEDSETLGKRPPGTDFAFAALAPMMFGLMGSERTQQVTPRVPIASCHLPFDQTICSKHAVECKPPSPCRIRATTAEFGCYRMEKSGRVLRRAECWIRTTFSPSMSRHTWGLCLYQTTPFESIAVQHVILLRVVLLLHGFAHVCVSSLVPNGE